MQVQQVQQLHFNGTGRATETITYEGGVATKNTADGKTSICYRGVENFWGNIWKFAYGINFYCEVGKPFLGYVCKDFNYAESKRTDNYKILVSHFHQKMDMFQQWDIPQIMIGCSYLLKSKETVHFLLVITTIRTTLGMDIGLLHWAVIGILVLLRVVSIGICIAGLGVVVVISAVAWCMYQQSLFN